MIYESLYTLAVVSLGIALAFAMKKINTLQRENKELRDLISSLKTDQ